MLSKTAENLQVQAGKGPLQAQGNKLVTGALKCAVGSVMDVSAGETREEPAH